MKKQFTLLLIIFFVSLAITSSTKASESSILTSHWDFNEGSGDIIYDSIGGHNGTRSGLTQWGSGYIDFNSGNRDVTNGHVNTGYFPSTKIFTLIMSVRIGAAQGDNSFLFVNNGFKLWVPGGTQSVKLQGFGVDDYIGVDMSGMNTIALVHNGSTIKIFRNGQYIKTFNNVSSENSTWDWFFGGNVSYLTSQYDDVKLYNIALTNDDVTTEFNNGAVSCTEDTWSCNAWNECSFNGAQTRSCTKTYDCSAVDTPSPSTSQSCTPTCTANNYSCSGWSSCSVNSSQTRTCSKVSNCDGGVQMPASSQSCNYVQPTCTLFTYSDWDVCQSNNTKTRTITTRGPENCTGGSPVLSQSCAYVPPVCSSWAYSDWGACSSSGQQTRTITSSSPSSCTGGSPIITQSCTYIPPTCTSWTYSGWGTCSSSGRQIRTITSSSPSSCTGGSPVITQSCAYTEPVCTSWSYSNWSACSTSGQQTRTVSSSLPSGCSGGSPALSQSCAYSPPPINPEAEDKCGQIAKDIKFWMNYDTAPLEGIFTVMNPKAQEEIRNSRHNTAVAWIKKLLNLALTYNCDSNTNNQNQQKATNCSADTWSCGNWGTCSPQGVQTRSCNKIFDCYSTETASPATSQYCEAPNKPAQQTPTENLGIVNQDSIVKATVKLICPVNNTMAAQGSGTVIDSKGTILTNKHVIDGTPGCLVGFINNYNDEPYFGDRQIADIYKISSDADIAILKLRNPNNRSITSIDITTGNSSNLRLGDQITTYGYPAIFGTKIKYTSGPFSGVDGNYLQTTAPIEHGNSGGGAYLINGTFIGIPTAVVKGTLNSMGYLLSINKINNWVSGSNYAYDSSSNNNYSRVSSILENIDLNTLNSLNLFIAENETGAESQKVIAEEKKLIIKIDNNLSKRMNGNILLQVEKNGEGWYVYPDDKKKYYLGRPADAFSIMRNLGLGIKHNELTKYLNSKFSSKLSGKILLDVEKNGEAYYVNPKDLKGYFLNRPADAFKVMRDLGLGITNTDIRKIGVGEIK